MGDGIERTLILVKPDAFARGLSGEIISRFERKGLTMLCARLLTVSEQLAQQHYAEHEGKPFFGELVDFIIGGPLVALALEGPEAIVTVRTMMGSTNPLQSAPGTIRGDLAVELSENVVHGSDSPESAERELGIFFADGDLLPAS